MNNSTALVKPAPQTFTNLRLANAGFAKVSVSLADDGVVYRRTGLIGLGSTEEHINYRAIASVRAYHGLFFSRLCIETSGGSQPIVVNWMPKKQGKALQSALRAHGAAR